MHLDAEALTHLGHAVGHAEAQNLVRIYLRFSAEQNARLAGLESLDAEGQRELIHAVRGGSLHLGTERLNRLCRELEHDLRQTGRTLAAPQIQDLRDTLATTRAALETWLESR